MSHHVSEELQTKMLLAVDLFDEAHKTTADGTPRDYDTVTEEFWKAFAEWAPVALYGQLDIVYSPHNGRRTVEFKPNQ